jgi:hypothetical protein
MIGKEQKRTLKMMTFTTGMKCLKVLRILRMKKMIMKVARMGTFNLLTIENADSLSQEANSNDEINEEIEDDNLTSNDELNYSKEGTLSLAVLNAIIYIRNKKKIAPIV